jgi:hypothetical protein
MNAEQLVQEVQHARNVWLRLFGVPISQEFADFASAIGRLQDWALGETERVRSVIAQERERCAQIAEEHPTFGGISLAKKMRIAETIRASAPKETP